MRTTELCVPQITESASVCKRMEAVMGVRGAVITVKEPDAEQP
jgi:hypothetical protein